MRKSLVVLFLFPIILSCVTDASIRVKEEDYHTMFGGKIMYNGSDFIEPEFNGTYLDNLFILIRNPENNRQYILKTKDGVFVRNNIAPGKYNIISLYLLVNGKSISWTPSSSSFGNFIILPDRINITGRMYWNCTPTKTPLYFTNIEYEEVRSYFDEYIVKNNITIEKWNYVTIGK